jgi:hypothetical protein
MPQRDGLPLTVGAVSFCVSLDPALSASRLA